ncbi:interleukin 21 isoform X2 [Takifugu rubripes]|uniref:interleukin 21 isoform X2 n=1 Tax=Takifugu rubripes TaxID=31033 RepID=UPI0005D27C9B|nr:interleukin-21 isoform X2 [Takifugu rubripes]|eukprot:XP_011609274.1 PREDICTED: interleukin-21 isoform X2 [Takifugu rubripes]
MGSPPVASCSCSFTFTHQRLRGPTHAQLDDTVGSRSGQWKRKSLVTRAGFCCFPTPCEWFSCLLRNTYKKVRCATLRISSQSSEKHLLTSPVADSENMKPLVLCLFAVCCWCVADASADVSDDKVKQQRKLEEILRELGMVKRRLQVGPGGVSLLFCRAAAVFTHFTLFALQNSKKMLSTPSENIGDCCCLSALKCFRENFKEIFSLTDLPQKKLYRSLTNTLTEKGLDFCDSKNSTCQDCHSHPEEKAEKFFDRLNSLIQKAIDRLMVYQQNNS